MQFAFFLGLPWMPQAASSVEDDHDDAFCSSSSIVCVTKCDRQKKKETKMSWSFSSQRMMASSFEDTEEELGRRMCC